MLNEPVNSEWQVNCSLADAKFILSCRCCVYTEWNRSNEWVSDGDGVIKKGNAINKSVQESAFECACWTSTLNVFIYLFSLLYFLSSFFRFGWWCAVFGNTREKEIERNTEKKNDRKKRRPMVVFHENKIVETKECAVSTASEQAAVEW